MFHPSLCCGGGAVLRKQEKGTLDSLPPPPIGHFLEELTPHLCLISTTAWHPAVLAHYFPECSPELDLKGVSDSFDKLV